ncbi:Putative leucine-rich repeat-containing protein DDB_G0290503 [Talaromyces islandicus]|uniref:Putative leucine-rich repeat-containing protein DDB_G0290503 n=1 Tax=Talaromyces islandicus TaxID=28573 RepID=A0A0U1LQM4_TALIS|nr:Putative leucine-rich repeat-containing protein DDB_G0290503 [Talaromyces islandicus]
MPLPYIDTPRTEIDANATYLTNGLRSAYRGNLSALDSVENSFQTPSKDDDVIKSIENGRRASNRVSLNTPRASGSGARGTRNALNDRKNLPSAAPPKGEFTPMMRSVTRNNYLRNMSAVRGSAAKTPAYFNRSSMNTPGLPRVDMTYMSEEGPTNSFAIDDITPVPEVASSSPQGTPLPHLSRRGDAGGVLGNDPNVLSLKEQENAINKLDKENFGLKLKIHYMQELLDRAGPENNQAALKENTELKVVKVTLQREISRYKKNLQSAERDLEAYRLQLQELREKAKRRQADESLQREMEWMREEIATRETQVTNLQEELRNAKERESDEADRLRDEVEDLEATLREKERIIDEKDDIIDNLKDAENKDSDAVGELETELERTKQRLEELQSDLDQAKADAREAKQSQQLAIQEKEKAEENLKELQDEMANKSFSTKGLNRQIEEKAAELEEEVRQLRQERDELKEDYAAKERREEILEDQLQEIQREHAAIREQNENAQQLSEQCQTERDEALNRLREVLDDLDSKAEEKQLLQTRHNALTDESAGLQRELANAQSLIRRLEEDIEDEKQRSLDSNHNLRAQQKEEVEHLQEEIDSLHQEIEDKEGEFALEHDRWESARRTLESQKERLEEQAIGYQRVIQQLQDVELTSSGREAKLQEIFDTENNRHLQEEAVLTRQVKDMDQDIASKRQIISDQRNELLTIREELRVSRREEENLKEKVKALEDEVTILQASLREEKEYSKGRALKGVSDQESQLQKALSERQGLRDQLANANVELHNLRASVTEVEAERDMLQKEIDRIGSKATGDKPFDQEKIELRKAKLRLENELQRLSDEKKSLTETRDSLEKELNAEIERSTAEENRLATEIAQLQDKLHAQSGTRDRELTLARSKVQNLEKRLSELGNSLEQQQSANPDATTTVGAEISILRQNLDESRKREKALAEREADYRKSAREQRTRISELEQELHEAQMKKLNLRSPEKSPSGKLQEELRTLRKKLSEAQKHLNDLKIKNRELERGGSQDEERRDLHELLRSSTIEAETLALKLSDRDARISDLKATLQRIREERASAIKEANKASQKIEMLQDRYEQIQNDMAAKPDHKGRHEKELRGLGKEIVWLKARLKREEKFRRDLAWSKGLMELGERVRVACNEADLRMIAQMGIKAPESGKLHDARRKFKTAGLLVVAIIRMQRMSQEWCKTRKIGEGLQRAKTELLRRRDSQRSGKSR